MALPVRIYSEAIPYAGGVGTFTPGLGTILANDVLLFFIACTNAPGLLNGTLAFTPNLTTVFQVKLGSFSAAVQPFNISVFATQNLVVQFLVGRVSAPVAGPTWGIAVTGWPDGIAIMQVFRNCESVTPLGVAVDAFGENGVFGAPNAAIEPMPTIQIDPSNGRPYGWPVVQYLFRVGEAGVLTPPVPSLPFPLAWNIIENLAGNGLHVAVIQYSIYRRQQGFTETIETNPPASWSITSESKSTSMAALMPAEISPSGVVVGCSPDSV